MDPIPTELPLSPDEQERHEALVSRLEDAMARAPGGVLPFPDYMEIVLYAPEIGYYSRPASPFGVRGDFVTAPELGPLFGELIAVFVRSVLADLPGGELLEAGAGDGALARSLLPSLAAGGNPPSRYWVIERSRARRARLMERLSTLPASLRERVAFCDDVPPAFTGVILANELLDALPCERFVMDDGKPCRLGVTMTSQGFQWAIADGVVPGADHLTALRLCEGYCSEVPWEAQAWVERAGRALAQGLILLIDYGFPRHEFYHPERSDGTLMCHFRHRAHPDPLQFAGLQDITTHIDFTSIAEAADAAALKVHGFTTQGAFLWDLGIDERLSRIADETTRRRLTTDVKLLTLPSEMGELFKVMALSRGLPPGPLAGFRLLDQRARL